MFLKSITQLAAPGGTRARLSILIFHRVLAAQDPLFPEEADERRFDEVLQWVRRWYRVMPLDEAVDALREDRLPARAMAITFDDGYADNATRAVPILQRHGMTATFFVATSFLDGGRMWNDTVIESLRRCTADSVDLGPVGLTPMPLRSAAERRAAAMATLRATKYLPADERHQQVQRVQHICAPGALPDDLMMQTAQVRGLLRAGMQVGAHTRTHPILSRISDDQARHEIHRSKEDLQDLLGRPVNLFAYPNGKPGVDYAPQHVAMVRESGFSAAVSTSAGASARDSDFHQLPRFTPWDQQAWRFGVRLLRNTRSAGARC